MNTNETTQQPTEQQIRQMRDRVFLTPATDKAWDACRASWSKPESLQWLKDHDFEMNYDSEGNRIS